MLQKEKAAKAKQKGVGRGGGRAAPPAGSTPSGGTPRGRGKAPTSVKPTGVPGRQQSSCKHNPFSALASAMKQSAKAAKKRPPPHDSDNDNDPDYDYEDDRKHSKKNLDEYQKSAGKAPCISSCLPSSSKRGLLSTGAIKKPPQVLPRYSGTLPNQEVSEEH